MEKTVYLLNTKIPRHIYDSYIKFILPTHDNFRACGNDMVEGIYAWTDKKKYLNDFFELRPRDLYGIITIVFDDKEEFHKFSVDNKECRLDYHDFDSGSDDGKSIGILTTFNEFIQVTENGSEYLEEFGINHLDLVDYEIFNGKIIDALDELNYTYEFDSQYGDESRLDNASFQSSYNLSSMGSRLQFNIRNEVNVLLHLYRFFFSEKRED